MEIIITKNVTQNAKVLDPQWRQEKLLNSFTNGHCVCKMTEGDAYHTNYLSYLGMCWSGHFGVIVDPTYLWQMILCELANVVKNNSEAYRHHFTDSSEKKEILIPIDDPIQINVKELCSRLRSLINEDIDTFLPQFSTQTEQTELAHCAAFCDAVSPFYNYGMYLCNIPKIKVLGTTVDWQLFKLNLEKLKVIFTTKIEWLNEIIKIDFLSTDVDFWKGFFRQTRCGSGSQYIIDGWITKLFMEIPSFALENNFSSHVSEVQYKNLANEKEYTMFSGLFSSKIEDDYLVPQFSMIINEKVQENVEPKPKQDPIVLM